MGRISGLPTDKIDKLVIYIISKFNFDLEQVLTSKGYISKAAVVDNIRRAFTVYLQSKGWSLERIYEEKFGLELSSQENLEIFFESLFPGLTFAQVKLHTQACGLMFSSSHIQFTRWIIKKIASFISISLLKFLFTYDLE